MGRTIRKEQPDGWNGSHLLKCSHSLNSRSRIDYLMYCNVLKTMSDGRLKVFVYGKRYHSVQGGRIRYVNDWQVSPAEKWDVKKYEDRKSFLSAPTTLSFLFVPLSHRNPLQLG